MSMEVQKNEYRDLDRIQLAQYSRGHLDPTPLLLGGDQGGVDETKA